MGGEVSLSNARKGHVGLNANVHHDVDLDQQAGLDVDVHLDQQHAIVDQ